MPFHVERLADHRAFGPARARLAPAMDQPPGAAGVRSPHIDPLPMLSHAELIRQVDRALADCRRQGSRVSVLALQVTALSRAGGWPDGGEPTLPGEHSALDSFFMRLRGRVRHGDQVVRLDDRVAAVILPGAGDTEALGVETRLSRLLGGVYRHGNDLLQLQVASGRSTYPELGVRGRELVLAATRPLRWRERT